MQETEATRRRHAETFAAQFERADDAFFRDELSDDALCAAYSVELDNLRAAMGWAVAQAPLLGVGIFAHSERLLFLMDLRPEGWLWSERLRAGIDEAAAPLLAAKFWLARCHVRTWQLRTSEVDESSLIIGHAVRLFRAVGDGPRLMNALGSLAMIRACDGDDPGAQAALAEMQAMEEPGSPIWLVALRAWVQAAVDQFARRMTGTQDLDHVLAGLRAIGEGEGRIALMLRTSIGQKLLLQRRFDEAAELLCSLCEQARRQHRDSNQMAWLLSGPGLALTAQGRLGQARGVLVEALPHLVRSGLLRPYAPPFAWLLAREGRCADAARLLGAASDPSFRRRADIFHASVYTQELLAASAAPESVAAWVAEGAGMDHEALVAMLLR